uniref:Monooxygenase FAD-binding protein n=1 Tax=Micromonospora sp. HK160111 TaxID=1245497 RepID=A0A2H4RBY4_9ACTN|nr:monooxygenase FAD-binding protein [Micromonospora sp. HK160111]
MAVLLAARGHDVVVVERWPQPYPMPRAVAFDGESARILTAAGLGEHISEFGEPSGDYVWENGQGQELLHFDALQNLGESGWPDSTSMYQPGLERALTARGAELPTLRVLRGRLLVDLAEEEDGVRAGVQSTADGVEQIRASWVVGCDGANSFVRERIGTGATDLGFRHDWLICDVELDPPREFKPNNLQVCDPARPRTAVSAGPGHRRWEFMRVAGDSIEELNTPEAAWRLLALFGVEPGGATLQRHAVYTFEARYADRWRSGRMLIAGDAAHLMPPFAAQGMSSGFRDAANLAWKLDLVLTGRATADVLDSYTEERRRHVQHAITMSVGLGRVICQTDPEAAADRDAMMLAARARGLALSRPPSAVESLTTGVLQDPTTRLADAPVGHLVPHSRVSRGGRSGLFDDVVGYGFALIASAPPTRLLDQGRLAYLERLGTRLVHLVPSDAESSGDTPGSVTVDTDGRYLSYLGDMGAEAALVRPDFYLFGAAQGPTGVRGLVDDLRRQLS